MLVQVQVQVLVLVLVPVQVLVQAHPRLQLSQNFEPPSNT